MDLTATGQRSQRRALATAPKAGEPQNRQSVLFAPWSCRQIFRFAPWFEAVADRLHFTRRFRVENAIRVDSLAVMANRHMGTTRLCGPGPSQPPSRERAGSMGPLSTAGAEPGTRVGPLSTSTASPKPKEATRIRIVCGCASPASSAVI